MAVRSSTAVKWERAVLGILLAGAVLVPVVVSLGGNDHFRLPKQLLLYAIVIVAAATMGVGVVLQKIDVPWSSLRVPLLLAAAGLAWAIVTTLTSTHRILSVEALIWGTSLAVLFLMAAVFLERAPIDLVAAAVLLPGLINATIVVLQAARIWNPWIFPPEITGRLTHNALLGNPDDAGVYLAVPMLFAFALTLVSRGIRVAVYLVAALILAAGVVATQTLTAAAAVLVAVPLMLVLWRRRAGIILALASVTVVLCVVVFYAPIRDRVVTIAREAREGHWDRALRGRTVPFAAAWEMFTDRPLVGVGPGAFKYQYMPYRMQLRQDRPELFAALADRAVNFGEVHNDHLQLLAEMGLPGYLVVLAGIVFAGSRSRFRQVTNRKARLGALLAAPLAVMLLLMMVAQFGLQIAASAFTYVFLGAGCIAWTRSDDPA